MNKITKLKVLTISVSLFVFLSVIYLLTKDFSPVDNRANAECGILAYDWNTVVRERDRGFPKEEPPRNNFNWKSPVNYAGGVMHYRAEIKAQPVPQKMRLQLCFWQPDKSGSGDNFAQENCGQLKRVNGNPGVVETWSQGVGQMWKKDGVSIDWARPRFRSGVAIKNLDGDPVSNFSGWEWNGEDPKQWYPLNMRFSAVVVPSSGTFCGWDYYLNGGQKTTNTPTPGTSEAPTQTPVVDSPTPSVTVISTPTNTPQFTPTPSMPVTPSATSTVSLTSTPTTIVGNVCGKADVNNDGRFTLLDFSDFAKAYGIGTNTCADKNVDYGACGGRDANKDGKLNIADFGGAGIGFAQRYFPKTSCALD